MQTGERLPTYQEADDLPWQEPASEGYTIKKFSDTASVDALRQLHLAIISNISEGFFTSVWSAGEIRTAVFVKIPNCSEGKVNDTHSRLPYGGDLIRYKEGGYWTLLHFSSLEYPGALQREVFAADFNALHAATNVPSLLWTKLWQRFRQSHGQTCG